MGMSDLHSRFMAMISQLHSAYYTMVMELYTSVTVRKGSVSDEAKGDDPLCGANL